MHHARNLGIEIGPFSAAAQWTMVLDKIRARFPRISFASSLDGPNLVFNKYMSGLIGRKSQFAEILREVWQLHAQAAHRVTTSAWQAISP